jgi:DNA-directed RNA polymerase subunit RPC12/RpoP
MQTHPNDSMKITTPQQQPVPASPDYRCPKCFAENVDRVVHLWFVVDERGPHIECNQCTYAWKVVAS